MCLVERGKLMGAVADGSCRVGGGVKLQAGWVGAGGGGRVALEVTGTGEWRGSRRMATVEKIPVSAARKPTS